MDASGGQKRAAGLLDLEVEMAVSTLDVGTTLHSARVVCILLAAEQFLWPQDVYYSDKSLGPFCFSTICWIN